MKKAYEEESATKLKIIHPSIAPNIFSPFGGTGEIKVKLAKFGRF